MNLFENPVFNQINQKEYQELQNYGFIREATYQKNEMIFHTGDQTDELGILLSGKVLIESIDFWGNRMILHHVDIGQAFAETYAFCNIEMMVDVIAKTNCHILFLNIKNLLQECHRHQTWYTKILYNLLKLSSQKNLIWSSRMFCISSKHIRTRVMTYLSSEAIKHHSKEIIIPFNRQQMADYLNVERTALSKELGKMKKEGILTYHKNKFYLLSKKE